MVRLAVLMVVLGIAAVAMMLTGRSSWASALVFAGFVLGGYAIYRMRSTRSTAVEQFFGDDASEETRHAGLGAGNPGDMPVDPDRRR